MLYELLIQNREGTIKDYANTAKNLKYVTNRTGSPGKFTFKVHKTKESSFHEGDRVRFSVEGTLIFFGYIFTKKKDRYGLIEVICYDQLRYLSCNESYCFIGKTAGEIIKVIANDFELDVGDIEDTGYVIPSLIKENKSCLDIISYALDLTTVNTGKIFVFFDDGGKLALKSAENMMDLTVLGDSSLVQDYLYTTDIDSETYNRIKLVRANSETGKADTYILEDSSTQTTWGILQYYEQVDEEMNEAQIIAQAETMLSYYNRVLRTLELTDVIGVIGLHAGCMSLINIEELGDISLSKFVLLEKVTHNFESDLHLMDVECKITI